MTEEAVHDSQIMDNILVEANSYYLVNKGYVKFDFLYLYFYLNNAFFVIRTKENIFYKVIDGRDVN